MSSDRRVMPADTDAEHALVGAVLLGADLGAVAGNLSPDDFYGKSEAKVYAAMIELHRAGEPIDIGLLQGAVGNEIIVSGYVDGMPRNANVEHYARRIQERADWRRMAKLAQELQGRALSADGDVAALARTFAVDLASIGRNGNEEDTTFEVMDGRYKLTAPAIGAELEVDYLRRDSSQLKCELMVRCSLPGARTHGGILMVTDANLSSSRSRSMLAKDLDERAGAKGVFRDVLEELAQCVLAAEREGAPDVGLHEIDAPGPVEILDVDGLLLPRCHPTVLFGDGDTGKSYLVLYVLGQLQRQGLNVGLADWELSEADHRDRLGRLFGTDMPAVRYLRCARPIIHEADRLRRWVRDRQLDFIAFDSVAYASGGAPENADVAMEYFQIIRQLGEVGSIHIAHITKATEGADRRPFGSTFWHNSPRATWYVKRAEHDGDEHVTRLGLFARKFNIGALPRPVGFELFFAPDRTVVRSVKVEDVPDLAASLTVRQRMFAVLRHGAMSLEAIAAEIDAKPDTISRTARRYSHQFTVIDGGRVALSENRR